jgi:hypothetical protein
MRKDIELGIVVSQDTTTAISLTRLLSACKNKVRIKDWRGTTKITIVAMSLSLSPRPSIPCTTPGGKKQIIHLHCPDCTSSANTPTVSKNIASVLTLDVKVDGYYDYATISTLHSHPHRADL